VCEKENVEEILILPLATLSINCVLTMNLKIPN